MEGEAGGVDSRKTMIEARRYKIGLEFINKALLNEPSSCSGSDNWVRFNLTGYTKKGLRSFLIDLTYTHSCLSFYMFLDIGKSVIRNWFTVLDF